MYLWSCSRSTRNAALKRRPGEKRKTSASAPYFSEFALNVTSHFALADRLALVVQVLALGERQFDLRARPRPGEIHPRRHQRQSPLLRARDQPLDLGPVQQQLPRALRVVVVAGRRPVGSDVDAHQPDLAIADLGIGVLELRLAIAQ